MPSRALLRRSSKPWCPCFVWCPVQHVQRPKPPGMACLNSWWSARGEMVWSNEGPRLLTVVWRFGGLVGVAVYMICGGVISIAALQQQDFGSVGHQVQNCSVAWEGVSDSYTLRDLGACVHTLAARTTDQEHCRQYVRAVQYYACRGAGIASCSGDGLGFGCCV